MRLHLLLPVAVALAACASSAPPPVTTANTAAGSPHAAAASDLLGFLPAGSQMVMHIDVRALRTSELWKSHQHQIGAAIEAKLAGVIAACGFNPVEDLESIAVGMQVSTNQGVFVMRGFKRDRTVACLETYGLPNTTVTNNNGVLTLANESGAVNMLTFVDPTTLVMVGSAGPTAATLRAAVDTDRPLRGSRGFMATYDRLAGNAVMSVVVLPSFLQSLAAFGAAPVAMSSTMHVTDEIEFRLHMQYASAGDARKAEQAFAPRFETAKQMFYIARLETRGSTIVGQFKMDRAAIEAVWTYAVAAFAAGFNDGDDAEDESLPEDSVP